MENHLRALRVQGHEEKREEELGVETDEAKKMDPLPPFLTDMNYYGVRNDTFLGDVPWKTEVEEEKEVYAVFLHFVEQGQG